jgi:hypothetical protein
VVYFRALAEPTKRAQTFFQSLDADDVECLRRDPQLANHMKMLARELQTLASAVGAEVTGMEEEERQIE